MKETQNNRIVSLTGPGLVLGAIAAVAAGIGLLIYGGLFATWPAVAAGVSSLWLGTRCFLRVLGIGASQNSRILEALKERVN